MKLSILSFFEKINLLIIDPSYLLYAISKDKVIKGLLYTFILLLVSSSITAIIRTQRVKKEFPSQFITTFGELSIAQGSVTFVSDTTVALERRDISELSSILFGIGIEPSEMVQVFLTPQISDTLTQRAIQLSTDGYALTTAKSGMGSPDTTYATEIFTWPEFSSETISDMTFTEDRISQFLHKYRVSLFVSLWIIFALITLSLMVSYFLLLFILVLFYGRKDPILSKGLVRLKLVLYLSTPYFILFPLFSLVLDGLGHVSGVALVSSSIVLIRLSAFRRKQLIETGTGNEQ